MCGYTETFNMWGDSYIGAVTVLIVGGASIMAYQRKHGGIKLPQALGWLCLTGIVSSVTINVLERETTGIPWVQFLPLHYCDLMAVMGFLALTLNKTWAKAILFYGALTASLQALITPALTTDFPHGGYFIFFFSHGITIIAALMLPVNLGWKTGLSDPLKTLAVSSLYLAIIHPINVWLHTNFGFTRKVPEGGSILDALGSWPWYLLGMLVAGTITMYFIAWVCIMLQGKKQQSLKSVR